MIRTECKLILPINDNEGASLRSEREAIEKDLLNCFGGFNRQASSGVWQDPASGKVYHDDCMTYTIAAFWNTSAIRDLHRIARKACQIMRQECIYAQILGEVAFLSPLPSELAA